MSIPGAVTVPASVQAHAGLAAAALTAMAARQVLTAGRAALVSGSSCKKNRNRYLITTDILIDILFYRNSTLTLVALATAQRALVPARRRLLARALQKKHCDTVIHNYVILVI